LGLYVMSKSILHLAGDHGLLLLVEAARLQNHHTAAAYIIRLFLGLRQYYVLERTTMAKVEQSRLVFRCLLGVRFVMVLCALDIRRAYDTK
jgi:hypothetical protein